MAISRSTVDGRQAWVLVAGQSAMVLCLGADDMLYLPHWGAAANDTATAADYLPHIPTNRASQATFLDGRPLAYPIYGMPTFKEPALVVATTDGARATAFNFRSDDITDDHLALTFDDHHLKLQLILHFAVHADLDLIVRSAELHNHSQDTLTIERAMSAGLPLPPDAYDAVTLHGQWGREFEISQRPLLPGRTTTGSTRGLSSHEAHPWFCIRPRGEEAEHHGRVWFGSLAWSGNWLTVFEVERNDALNVVCGIQPFDFAWRLAPDESFTTPQLVCGYAETGLGGASRLLHAYEETVQLPPSHRDQLRPVLYNSWEATHFDVSAAGQIELARVAADLGVELFVVDDGWFGARDHDRAGLGDWTVNRTKFPAGLRQLSDEVHRLGMRFGIWVEPEMANPDSDLFRAHPDWVYHATGRAATLGRNQLVLNFARPDVRQAIYQQLRDVLAQHGPIEFVKWDHNRAWTEVGWPEMPDHQREVWVRHVYGLYEVIDRLRSAFPRVIFESCASGGGRADLGMLRLTDQVWTSDNTDAADRLTIQYGFSRAHTPRAMVNWVTDVPNEQTGRLAPLEFRFHVAMQGVLGIGGNISRWTAAERAAARDLVHIYKTIRPVVQQGRQYWLRPPRAIGTSGVQYVSADCTQTVILLYQVRGLVGQGPRRLLLHNLLPERRYRRDGDAVESSGAALMAAGIPATPSGTHAAIDWRSTVQLWRAL